MKFAVVIAACMASACMPGEAQSAPHRADTPKVGDPAPPLGALEWLRGAPVTRFERGRLYVVVFSATWCPTSRKAIPHLTELAKQYAGRLTLINFFAREDDTRQNPQDLGYVDRVRYLMRSMGGKMDFNIAVDVPQQTTGDAWGIDGVPTAFVVDRDGSLAWIGAPAALDPVLRQIVTGSFDAAAALRRQEEFDDSMHRIEELRSAGEYRQAAAGLDALISAHPHNSSLYIAKYRVLAGHDDAQADALLEWLLKTDIPGFDWDHFVPYTYGLSADPDYELALAAMDHAIARAETEQVAARLLARKIDIYLSRSRHRSNSAEARGDVAEAVAALRRATDLGGAPDAPPNARLERSLRQSQFKVWAATGDPKANALLQSLLHDKEPGTNWSSYIDAALEHQRSPDYDLLLALAEEGLAQAEQRGWDRAYPLSRKAEVYAARGDTSRALAIYEHAVEAARRGSNAAALETYERRAAELRATELRERRRNE